jgi:hypothetical protein
MRMYCLILALCLMGCTTGGGVSPPDTMRPVTPVVIPPPPRKEITKAEWKRLTRDCKVVGLPPNADSIPADELAVMLANARKEALEECSQRMRKLRKAR